MKKNEAGQKVGAQMVDATSGEAFTGAVVVAVTGDGGTQAAGSVGAGACAHEGNGFHTYAPAQAETNYDHIAFTFTGSGAVPASVQVYTTAPQTGDVYALASHIDHGFVGLYELLNNMDGADATLAAATLKAIADAILGRNQAGGADGGRTVSQALMRMRNRQTVVAGVFRLYANDDTTVIFQANVTTDANGFITEFAPTT
jgi:hypothetical protein